MERIMSEAKRWALIGGEVLIEGRFVRSDVVIEGDRIVAVGMSSQACVGECVDVGGCRVVPGLIDQHFHGVRDKTCIGSTLAELAAIEAEYGVTGFVAGLVYPREKFPALLEKKRQELRQIDRGARCLGFFLEGPFAALPGAIPRKWMHAVDLGYARELIAAGGEDIRMAMVSPELAGVEALIELFVSRGIVVAMGHTDASIDQVMRSIDAGATVATHLYNVVGDLVLADGTVKIGQGLPAVTEPGCWPAGCYDAMVADDRVTVEVIGDGVHVHPMKARTTWLAKGNARVALITDCNVGAGLPVGRYEFPGWDAVEIRPNDAVRDAEHGWLSGSALTMDEGLRRSARVFGCTLADACEMGSATVAKALRVDGRLGKMQPGYVADVIVLNDRVDVTMTIVGGRVMYRRDGRGVA
jgi:N-acetylglucosamine-6-phosphate deacetylase